MKRGTVVLTPFPFSDLAGNKVRPAVIISSDQRTGNDIVVAFISSIYNISALQPTDIPIAPPDSNYELSGLKKPSIIKVEKLATIDKKIALGEIGKFDAVMLSEIDKRLKIVFGLI